MCTSGHNDVWLTLYLLQIPFADHIWTSAQSLMGTYQHRVNNQKLTYHIRNLRMVLDFLVTLAPIPTRNEEMKSRNFHKISQPIKMSTFKGVCRRLLTVKKEEVCRKWLLSQRKFWLTTSLKCTAEWFWTLGMVTDWNGEEPWPAKDETPIADSEWLT
jgi:hypothetical protein